MKHFFYIDHILHDLRLPDVSGDTVKNERIDVRLKLVCVYRCLNRLPPQLDCDLVWHELAFALVIEEGFTQFRSGIDRAKYIATGAMLEARDRTERFTLRPFAAARRAKGHKRGVPHERNAIIPQRR